MDQSIKTISDSAHACAVHVDALVGQALERAGTLAAQQRLYTEYPGRSAIVRIGSLMLLLRQPSRETLVRAAAMLSGHAGGHWILGIDGRGIPPACGRDTDPATASIDVTVGRIMHPALGTLEIPATLIAFVPVGAEPALDAAFRAHGARVLSAPRAALVGNILLSVAGMLPAVPEREHAFLADAIRAVLLAALSSDGTQHAAPPATKARLRSRVERIIQRNLASARLDAARIARLAGISRTTLYRLFEGTGGVAAHVQRLRLDCVVDALRDPSQSSTPITAIAERNGFHCIASFNRSFRRAYGTAPGKMRAMALAGVDDAAAANLAADPHVTPDMSSPGSGASRRCTGLPGGEPACTADARRLAIPVALPIGHDHGRMDIGLDDASPPGRFNSLLP